MIFGVAGLVIGMFAGIEPSQVFECALDRVRGRSIIQAAIHAQRLARHLLEVGRSNRIGDVMIAATHGAVPFPRASIIGCEWVERIAINVQKAEVFLAAGQG